MASPKGPFTPDDPHPPALVGPQTSRFNRFLVPATPSSISAHPDHSLFPSFKLLSPGFVAEQSPRQISPASDADPLLHARIFDPRHRSSAQQRRAGRKRKAARMHLRTANLSAQHPTSPPRPSRPRFSMPSPPHPAANYLPFPEPIVSPRESFVPGMEKESIPSASEDTALLSYLSPETDADYPRPWIDGQRSVRPEHRDMMQPCTPQEAMLKASTTAVPWPCPPIGHSTVQHQPQSSRMVVDDQQYDHTYANNTGPENGSMEQQVSWTSEQDDLLCETAISLPVAYRNPAILFLNSQPFVGYIRQVLAAAGIQDHTMMDTMDTIDTMDAMDAMDTTLFDIEERYEPVWQQAYLRVGGRRYARAAPIKAQVQVQTQAQTQTQTHMPWHQAPDECRLANYIQTFSKYIQSIYPIIPSGRLGNLAVEFMHHGQHPGPPTSKSYQDPRQIEIEYAVELLVFALGSVCWAKCGGTIVEPGPEFYARAKGILEGRAEGAEQAELAELAEQAERAERAERAEQAEQAEQFSAPRQETVTLDFARAHLLAALFCGQLAWIPDAANHVHEASTAVLHLIHQAAATGGPPLVEYRRYPHVLAEEERQLVLLYWTCVLLEFEINTETGREPSALLHYQSVIPLSDFGADQSGHDALVPEGRGSLGTSATDNGEKQEQDVRTNFQAQVCLRGYLNRIYAQVYGGGSSSSQERSAVDELCLQFQGVSLSQPQPASAPKSILTARARAGYWEGLVWGFLPVLLRADQQTDPAELAAGVCSLTEVIRAYHGVADRFIVPNAFGAAMMQCRYLLLLFAASRTLPAVAEIVSDAVLDELIRGTAASLQGMASPPGVLEAARRVLRVLREQLQPRMNTNRAPMANEAASAPSSFARAPNLTVVTARGSGYEYEYEYDMSSFSSLSSLSSCPSLSGVLSTTTPSSFTSLSTPNTSQCWSSGTSPFPQAFPSPFNSSISSISSLSSLSSLSSPLASPYSAVASYSYTPLPKAVAVMEQVPPQQRSHNICSLWPPVAIQSVPEAPSCIVDVLGFSCQLGLADPLGSVGR